MCSVNCTVYNYISVGGGWSVRQSVHTTGKERNLSNANRLKLTISPLKNLYLGQGRWTKIYLHIFQSVRFFLCRVSFGKVDMWWS